MSAGYKFLEPFFFDLATKAALARRDNGAPAAVECGQCHPPAALPLRIMSFFFVCSLGCPEVGHSKLIFTAHFFLCVSSGPVIVVAVIGVAFLFLCDAALRRGPRRNWGPPAQKREIGRNSSAGRRGVSLAILWKNSKPAAHLLAGKKRN